MVIDTDEVFYLGDNPVVLQRTENPKDGSNLGFGSTQAAPITDQSAMSFTRRLESGSTTRWILFRG
jgi:hypothetical protein